MAPSCEGLGAGAPAIAGRTSPRIQPGDGPFPEEELKTDLSQSPSTTKGGARGRLAVPQESSRRRGTRRVESGCFAGHLTSPTGLMVRAVFELGALGIGGEGKAWGDGSSAASINSAGRALQGNGQLKQRESKGLRKEKAYSSMAKYFLRFNRRQG